MSRNDQHPVESQFMGGRRSKVWSFLFVGLLMVLAAIVVNVAVVNPDLAQDGANVFMGLPSAAFVGIAFVIGMGLYWIGLKVEADWPEMFGSFIVAGALFAGEVMLGLDIFKFGGIVIMPYLIPVVIFLIMMMNAMFRTR